MTNEAFIVACHNDWQGQNDGSGHYCEIFGEWNRPFEETPKTYRLTFRGIDFTLEKFHKKSRNVMTSWDRNPSGKGHYYFIHVTTTKELWRQCRRIIEYLTKRNDYLKESYWKKDEQKRKQYTELTDEIEMLKNLLEENGIPVSSEWVVTGEDKKK
jgi:hypothetical protein